MSLMSYYLNIIKVPNGHKFSLLLRFLDKMLITFQMLIFLNNLDYINQFHRFSHTRSLCLWSSTKLKYYTILDLNQSGHMEIEFN